MLPVHTQIAIHPWPGTLPAELGHPIPSILFLCCLFHPDSEICDQLQIYYLIHFILMIWDGPREVEWRSQGHTARQCLNRSFDLDLGEPMLLFWLVDFLELGDADILNLLTISFNEYGSNLNFFLLTNSQFVSWPKKFIFAFSMKSLSKGKYFWKKYVDTLLILNVLTESSHCKQSYSFKQSELL